MKIVIILCIVILFSESALSLQDQSSSDKFKRDAVINMDAGRYGEAIDLLNKYISARPQTSEGYYLRGICYEARGQYELSVYDLRSASKLSHKDSKISKALSRVTDVWYTQLYNKIEGHKREIVIYPTKPVNYLEIGKCYKNLGNWSEAEEWYDKYLKLQEPSADEVIRYTEILAKNNHINKGEIILKKFVEKYPEDHRLWSRYGYFTLWLGKYKISIAAFSDALHIRPFFKEAIDGLNLAQGKGFIYTVNDTSYRYNKLTGGFQKQKTHEYPIDRYFKILKQNPSNDSVRIVLINELVKVNRFEEAKQQLNSLDKNNIGRYTFVAFEKEIAEKLDQYFVKRIEKTKSRVNSNPSDRKSVLELANYFIMKNNIDSAEYAYLKYLEINPNDNELRFELAKKLSWFKEFEKAKKHADIILEGNPNKLEYQLLRGQIAVWTNMEPEYASKLLNNVLDREPENLQALTCLAILNYQSQKFTASENYISRIEKFDPANVDAKELRYNLLIQQKQYEDAQSFELLQIARGFLNENKCEEAIISFKEYLSIVPDNEKVKYELANAYICSNDYSNAITIYSSLLDKKYDYDLAKQRAKWYFWKGDSLNALKEFKSLYALNQDDTEVKLFLGDSYFNMKDYSNAKKIYSELLTESPSSMLVNTRLNWLPQDAELDGTFSSFISNFPTYILLMPEAYYFKDNLSFKYNLQGLRAELGFTNFISVGASVYRGDVSSDSLKQKFNTITGNLTVIPTKLLTTLFSFGQTKYLDNQQRQNIADISLKSEIKDKYYIIGRYISNDAAQTLYSPFLVDTNLRVIDYSIEGAYYTAKQMVLSGRYSFKKISDDNKSNELTLRIGRKFSSDFSAGYEYYNLSYDFETPLYYSPSRFESHSLWGDYNIIYDTVMDFSVGGKVGLIPNSDLLVKELNAKLSLKLFESFTLQGQGVFSENSREQVNYSSTSISFIAFWSL
jgi:tetratricopeptide (TPR) repeat protein